MEPRFVKTGTFGLIPWLTGVDRDSIMGSEAALHD